MWINETTLSVRADRSPPGRRVFTRIVLIHIKENPGRAP
jgi:hypothetical protein